MDIQQTLQTTCIFCLEPGCEVGATFTLSNGGEEYACILCPKCAPRVEANDRATYYHVIPTMGRNLEKLVSEHAR